MAARCVPLLAPHYSRDSLRPTVARRRSACLLVFAVSVVTTAAPADELPVLEMIVVTASKREEQLQRVPQAISAISGKTLESIGAENFVDYARTVPGLTYTDLGAARQRPALRGVSVTTGSAAVNYYIGETPVPATSGTLRLSAVNPKLVDIDRVEVLRGPQGTLYGSSSLGGTIKFIPAAPAFDSMLVQGRLALEAIGGDGTGVSFNGTVNMPLAERFAARASVWYRNADGFITRRLVDNLFGDVQPSLSDSVQGVPEEESSGARLNLAYRPLSNLDIDLMVFHQKQDFSGFQDFTFGATNQAQGPYQDMLLAIDEPSSRGFDLYSLTAHLTLGPTQLVSVTSWYDGDFTATEESTSLINAFFGGEPFSARLEEGQRSESFTQELRIATTERTHGFDALAGVFYREEDDRSYTYWAPPGWNGRFASQDPSLFTPNNNLFVGNTKPELEEISFFGEASYRLTNELTFTAGARHYDIESGAVTQVSGLFNDFANPSAVTTTTIAAQPTGEVYKFNISYDLNATHLLYGQYSEGFRPGFGLNPLPANCDPDLVALGIDDADLSQVGPDSTRNYEFGAKTAWRSGRVIANAAAYRIDWRDIQQSLFLPCGARLVRNAGEARNQGIELEIQARLNEHVDVGGSISYIDSQFQKDAPEFGASEGDPIADVPPWQGAVFTNFYFSTPVDWDANARIDLQYTDSTYFDYRRVGDQRDPLSLRDALTLLNLHVAFSRGPWRIEVYGDNLLDDVERMSRAESLVLEVPGRPRFIINQPRTFGLAVSFSY